MLETLKEGKWRKESQCKQRWVTEVESEKSEDFHREWGMYGVWVKGAWQFFRSRNAHLIFPEAQ